MGKNKLSHRICKGVEEAKLYITDQFLKFRPVLYSIVRHVEDSEFFQHIDAFQFLNEVVGDP